MAVPAVTLPILVCRPYGTATLPGTLIVCVLCLWMLFASTRSLQNDSAVHKLPIKTEHKTAIVILLNTLIGLLIAIQGLIYCSLPSLPKNMHGAADLSIVLVSTVIYCTSLLLLASSSFVRISALNRLIVFIAVPVIAAPMFFRTSYTDAMYTGILTASILYLLTILSTIDSLRFCRNDTAIDQQ